MIKSLLEDEEPKDEAENGGSGFFRKRRGKREFLSIDLSDSGPEPEEKPAENEDELRAAFRGESSPKKEFSDAWNHGTGSEAPPPDSPVPSGENLSARTAELERKLKEIEEELRREKARTSGETPDESVPRPPRPRSTGQEPAAIRPKEPAEVRLPFGGSANEEFISESPAESFRKGGLAWSAAIALFGSVVFMLTLGWFADLLIGSSPWGIVVGIVIGSAVGFLQFFRITSQILRPGKSDFERVSLRFGTEENKGEQDSGAPLAPPE